MAHLVTLSGSYSARRQYRHSQSIDLDELMGAATFMDFIKDTGKAVISPVISLVKGTGHIVGEVYRGGAEGDIGRILLAPVKGVSHAGMSLYRDEKAAFEYYYQPSKMAAWMQPVGTGLSVAGMVPTPLSPFLIGGGALLTIGGGIASSKLAGDRAKTAKTKIEADDIIAKQKQKNMMYYGIAVVGTLALLYTMV